MKYYQHHIGDYEVDTKHLSILEDGIYRRLIDLYYVRDGEIPSDIKQIARLIGARTEGEIQTTESILNEFFKFSNNKWSHTRCDFEIQRCVDKSNKAREAAGLSVQSRLNKNSINRKRRLESARKKGTHTEDEWNELIALCGNKCVRCGNHPNGENKLTKDHVIPLYQHGSDSIDNLQPLCKTCNSSKGPENIDYVAKNIRVMFAKRTLNERSTNVELTNITKQPNNQINNGDSKTAPPIEKKEEEKPNFTDVRDKIAEGLSFKTTRGITKPWQEEAFRYAKELGMELDDAQKGRWIKLFKETHTLRPYMRKNLQIAYSFLSDLSSFRALDTESKMRYFFNIFYKGPPQNTQITNSFVQA